MTYVHTYFVYAWDFPAVRAFGPTQVIIIKLGCVENDGLSAISNRDCKSSDFSWTPCRFACSGVYLQVSQIT